MTHKEYINRLIELTTAHRTWKFQEDLEVTRIVRRIQANRAENKRKNTLELIKRNTIRHEIKAIQYKRIKK